MKMIRSTMIALVCAMPLALSAASMQEIKERMADRLPAVSELKEKQWVGESNEGYLEVLKPENVSAEQTEVVDAENADRRLVYAKIADHVDATVQLVGQQRAEAIRKQSAPGIMIQMPDGTWKAKQ